MNYKESIEIMTEEILSNEIDYLSLREKLQGFCSLLMSLTKLDLYKPINRKNIRYENGIALNTSDAVMCVVDIMRTRQFVRGIFKAVKQVQNQKPFPIRIMYAGTGPFALLILPLLTKYSSDELKLNLLEVNGETRKYLRKLIEKLGIEDYIEKIVSEDATKYKLDKQEEVDILISETMQFGLVKEQQVPIMINLVSQLKKDVIIIPQKIQLDLALMNTSTKLILNNTAQPKYKLLKTLLEFDKQFVHTHSEKITHSNRIELSNGLQFKEDGDKEFDKLVVLTSIQVFADEWISDNSSSLTIYKEVLDLNSINNTEKNITMDYVIKAIPDFEYTLS